MSGERVLAMSYFGGSWSVAAVLAGPVVFAANEAPATCCKLAAALFLLAAGITWCCFGKAARREKNQTKKAAVSSALPQTKRLQNAFCSNFMLGFVSLQLLAPRLL